MSILFSHPIKKLTLLAAFGGGYVLGAKAGRERYEQILETAHQVTEDPRVKDVVTRAEDILRDAGLKQDEEGGSHRLDADGDAPTIPVPTPPPARPTPPAPPAPPSRDLPIEDEVVYSSGPDVEETIDELIDLDTGELPADERHRDNG